MFKRYLFSLVIFVAAACGHGNGSPQAPAISSDTAGATPLPEQAAKTTAPASRFQFHKIDTLSKDERAFLKRLAGEEPSIIWSSQVERYYKADSSLLASCLVFPDGFLRDSGYVYFVCTAAGKFNEPGITYNFSRGQADQGYGSVSGEDTSSYVHTIKSFGTAKSIVRLFQNGRKVFEKME